jgi:O-antigen/teichoic acid export membrane protein
MTLAVLGEVIRKNPQNLRNRYYRFRMPIEAVAAGAAGFVLATGNLIINILYDERYSQAGLMLKILSLGLLIYPFQLIRSAFTAIGKTHVVAAVSVLQAASLVSCLSLGFYFFGTLGAISGVAINRIFPSMAIIFLAHRLNWISVWKELRWIPIYACGFLIGEIAVFVLGPYAGIRHFFR